MKQHTAEGWVKELRRRGWPLGGQPAPFPGKHPLRIVLWSETRIDTFQRVEGQPTRLLVPTYVPVFKYFGKPSATVIRSFVAKAERLPFGARTLVLEVDRKNMIVGYSATGPIGATIRARGFAIAPSWRNDNLNYAYHPFDPVAATRMLGQYQLPQFVKRVGGWTFRCPKETLSRALEVNPFKDWLLARGYIKNEQRTAKTRV